VHFCEINVWKKGKRNPSCSKDCNHTKLKKGKKYFGHFVSLLRDTHTYDCSQNDQFQEVCFIDVSVDYFFRSYPINID
jgi:hypothetical protein